MQGWRCRRCSESGKQAAPSAGAVPWLRCHSRLRGCRFSRLCLDGELSRSRTALRNDRKRMLTHGKCSNKITVQRDYRAALSLCIVLFFQRSAIKLYTKEIGEGCVRSERQLLFLALCDRCTITGRDFRGQLCRYGLSLGDFLCCFGVLVILVAASQYQYSILPQKSLLPPLHLYA